MIEISLERIYKDYTIKHASNEQIIVQVIDKELITVKPIVGASFFFVNSDPARVKRIGELLIEASKLVGKKDETN